MSNRTPEDLDTKNSRQRKLETDERDLLTRHRGLATWGEKLVPLGEFHKATRDAGIVLSDEARQQSAELFLARHADGVEVEGPFTRIAVFGGVYNNSWGVTSLLEQTCSEEIDKVYCLGDLGGFGPHPERVWPLLIEGQVRTIQGNYEESLASGREDCNCGYTDPRDNEFAEISYRYTEQNCSPEFKRWMGELPTRRRVRVGERELLLVHGSPRQINEFLFLSSAPVPFLEVILDQEKADGFLCTHTGLPWHRKLPSGRDVVNVGVIGRPANDGTTDVCYALLEDRPEALHVELRRLAYDHPALARAMRDEKLPEQFVDTILTGWWTTCLEILPARERRQSRF